MGTAERVPSYFYFLSINALERLDSRIRLAETNLLRRHLELKMLDPRGDDKENAPTSFDNHKMTGACTCPLLSTGRPLFFETRAPVASVCELRRQLTALHFSYHMN